MSLFENWLSVTAMAGSGEQMQSAHVYICGVSLGAKIQLNAYRMVLPDIDSMCYSGCSNISALLWSFLAATKQLYKWYFPSVRLSVRLSVCHTFFTMFPSSYHHEIFRSYYYGQKWCWCKRSRSKVKVTEVNTQLGRFRTLTPVWIHIWQWNHAHSWKQHRRGALLFFKVIHQISRSHGSKNRRIWPRLGVSGL